jgi:hypothetical protein
MKLFGRKSAGTPRARLHPANIGGHSRTITHRVTLDLARAQTFASMLATSRASQAVEVSDLLAGMYICNWERLSTYWEEEDREEIETFLRGICRISPQRWHSWIELYTEMRRKGERSQRWRPLAALKRTKLKLAKLKPAKPGNVQPLESVPHHSNALAAVFKHAEELAPSRDSLGGRNIPILTSECVLLCILRSFGSEVSRKLAATGLDAARLERDALFPRHAPLT